MSIIKRAFSQVCKLADRYCTCVCGVDLDVNGIHALSCRKTRSRHSRHSAVNQVIHRALRSAGVPSILEPTGLCRNDEKRPDGLTVLPWKKGQCLVWDATVVHRMAISYSSAAAASGSSVAKLAEYKKIDKYEELSREYIFQPVAIETLGGVGPSSLHFLRQLGILIEQRIGDADA